MRYTKIIISLFFAAVLTSCEDKLDIVPKGQVTLQKTTELEQMLNQEYMLEDSPCTSLGIIIGESYGMFDKVSSMMSQTNTCAYAYLTGKESVDRATITTNDARYNTIYKYISHMNVVINNIDEAQGDETRKAAIKAEAQVMRAYLHWLVAALYAQQYDDATAADEGGIAYCTSSDVTEQKTKLTLKATYEAILNDVTDDVISNLPDNRENSMRGDKAWGNAVRAVVLFQMKHYYDALTYAEKALTLRSDIFDRSQVITDGQWIQDETAEDNFLFIEGVARISPTMEIITPSTYAMFEPDDYVLKYDHSSGWSSNYGTMYSGMTDAYMYMTWTTNCNVWGLTVEQLMYLKAECLIRNGKISEGLKCIDDVRQYRIEDATQSTAGTEEEAMKVLQKAKWIECLNTPFNFLDVKRWNTEDKYKRTITHNLGTFGKFTIAPESSIWVMPFPVNAVKYNSSLTQNY